MAHGGYLKLLVIWQLQLKVICHLTSYGARWTSACDCRSRCTIQRDSSRLVLYSSRVDCRIASSLTHTKTASWTLRSNHKPSLDYIQFLSIIQA